MKIAMIMLAAGNSRRFGANKLLYEIDGIPMYRHVLEQLDDTKKKIENSYSEYSDITEDNNNDNNSDIVQLNNLYRNNITAKIICNIIVITQYDAIAEAVKTKEIQVLYNPHPEDGISSSVKIGLNASLDADAVLFTVSDQPWLTSETICELIHVFLNTSKGIACISYQGKMGNPCIFDRKYYNELLSLEGDKGGKKVIMKEDAGRGYRRVVASPKPVEIVEQDAINSLVDANKIVICCGGGGIPVVLNGHHLKGASAVIDKDYASCLLAKELDADMLIILTAVEKVAVNFGKENEEWLDDITVDDAKKYINEGQFAPGSMLPKVQAAVDFASSKEGRTAMITLLQKAKDGIQGKTGTKIHL